MVEANLFDSPAERAGLRTGDLIVTVDGAPVRDVNAAIAAIGNRPPGALLRLDIMREGRREHMVVTIGGRLADMRFGTAEDYLQRGDKHLLSGRLKEALADANGAVELSGRRVDALGFRARLLERIGRHAEANLDVRRVLAAEPGQEAATAALGRLGTAAKARVVVLLDSCQLGLTGSQGLATNDDVAATLLSGMRSPIVMLAASKGRQEAHEHARWGGGLFTYALSEVLEASRLRHDLNGNGVIEVSELYAGLKAMVMRESGGQQTPWLARHDLVGDFALF